MNLLWGGMLLTGMIFGMASGRSGLLSEAVLSSAGEAVELGITMMGIMAFWMGLMEIAKDAGLISSMERRIQPLIRFLFPGIPAGHPAAASIALCFLANFFGLGNAATPAGLQAMRELSELEEERRRGGISGAAQKRGTASREMCTFLILNISSLQLIPVSIIAYRTQYGSANPAGITGPAILATAASTGTAILFCKIMEILSKNSKFMV